MHAKNLCDGQSQTLPQHHKPVMSLLQFLLYSTVITTPAAAAAVFFSTKGLRVESTKEKEVTLFQRTAARTVQGVVQITQHATFWLSLVQLKLNNFIAAAAMASKKQRPNPTAVAAAKGAYTCLDLMLKPVDAAAAVFRDTFLEQLGVQFKAAAPPAAAASNTAGELEALIAAAEKAANEESSIPNATAQEDEPGFDMD